ncbi:MAG: hypothetical protein IRZ13_08000, partial [Acetobacteraceae bacterium]|nr:hypothetical protein [Acetobacteraceae bacterium]
MRRNTKVALLAATVIGLGATGAALAQQGPAGGVATPGPGGGAPTMGAPGPGGGPGWHHHHRGPGRRGGAGGFAAGEAFARADANGDGRVTRDEGWVWLQARFTEVDANKDGSVTL